MIKVSLDTNIWIIWFRNQINYKYVNELLKKVTYFDSDFEIILPDLLYFEIKYRLIKKKQRKSKKDFILNEEERIRIINALNEIIKSSKVSIIHTRIDYHLLEKLIDKGFGFQDAIICSQLSNSNINYFVTRDKMIRKYSKEFNFKITTPKGMINIINKLLK